VENKFMENALNVAVPMWVLEHQDKSVEWLMHRKDNVRVPSEFLRKNVGGSEVRSIASLIGERGDTLQYGGGKVGEVGFLFNCLAEGLAILSMICPGGVDFGELHFEFPYKDLKNENVSKVQKENQRPLESEAVPAVCEGVGPATGIDTDSEANSPGPAVSGEENAE
jgi:hypothetical protein